MSSQERSSSPSVATRAGVPSIISNDLKIVGNLHSSGDLQIDGAVEGDITSQTLTVGESAVVKGSLTAETVRIYGAVNGQVKATSVTLAKTAKVEGDIAHKTLAMEAGAELVGSLSRLEAGIGSVSRPATVAPVPTPTTPGQGSNGSSGTPSAS